MLNKFLRSVDCANHFYANFLSHERKIKRYKKFYIFEFFKLDEFFRQERRRRAHRKFWNLTWLFYDDQGFFIQFECDRECIQSCGTVHRSQPANVLDWGIFFCAFNDNMMREGLVFGFDYVVVCEGLVLWVFFCCWAAGWVYYTLFLVLDLRGLR